MKIPTAQQWAKMWPDARRAYIRQWRSLSHSDQVKLKQSLDEYREQRAHNVAWWLNAIADVVGFALAMAIIILVGTILLTR